MRRGLILAFLILGLCSWLAAQITVSCSPAEIFVNSLSTSSFDPINPQNQPLLTELTITNVADQPMQFSLGMQIHWNEILIVDNVTFTSRQPLQPNLPLKINNRDFISGQAGANFNDPDGDISIDKIIEKSTILRDALQSGYFPDGALRFQFTVEPLSGSKTAAESNTAEFTIRIKNIDAIYLSYPGNPLGQKPPFVSVRPVTFLWNSLNTAYDLKNREYHIVVREFVQANPPNNNSVETGGRKILDADLTGNVYSEFLPFQDKHFYAWQVSTELYNEYGGSASNQLKSEWYVFQFADTQSSGVVISQLRQILDSLNNNEIDSIFGQGFDVTGAVIYEGQVYTGKEAVDLARTLIGKQIEVEIADF